MVSYSCGFLLSLLGTLITLVGHEHRGFFPFAKCNIRVLNKGKGGHKTSGKHIQHHLGVSNPTEVGKFSAVEEGDTQSESNVEDELGDEVGNKVVDQVVDQVVDKVVDKVVDQVGDKLEDQVGDKVVDQVGDKLEDQVGNKVVDQVGDELEGRYEGEMSGSSSRGVGLLSDVSPHKAGQPFEDDMGEENNPHESPSNQYTFFEATNDRAIKKVESLSRPDQQNLLQQNFMWVQMPNIDISCRVTGCPETYQMCVPFSYDRENFGGNRIIDMIPSFNISKTKGIRFDKENMIEDKRNYILVYSCVCKKHTSDGSCDESVE